MNIIELQGISFNVLRSRPASLDQILALEAKLGFSFPADFREFMIVLGAGEACCLRAYLPTKKSIAKSRKSFSEYWFWTKSHDILTQSHAIECVPLFDTDIGDTIVFHPQDPNHWYILGHELDAVVVVTCLQELFDFYSSDFNCPYPYDFVCWDGAVSNGIWGYQSFENYRIDRLLELIAASPDVSSNDLPWTTYFASDRISKLNLQDIKSYVDSMSGTDFLDYFLDSRKDEPNLFEDVGVCCMKIAVAEIIAGLDGNSSPSFPKSLQKWLEGKPKPAARTIQSAKNAISSILDKSELKRLWQKQKEDYPKWLAVLEDLRYRLG